MSLRRKDRNSSGVVAFRAVGGFGSACGQGYNERGRSITLLLLLLGEVAGLILTTEQAAQAYVDPGTGYVSLQILGTAIAGSFYFDSSEKSVGEFRFGQLAK